VNPSIHIIGLGNPVAGDDAIGLLVVKELGTYYQSNPNIKLTACSQSGLYLLDLLVGFKTVIIIDAIIDEMRPIGEVLALELPEEQKLPQGISPHFIGITSVITLGEKYQLQMPENLQIIGVVIHEHQEIRERLSPELDNKFAEIISKTTQMIDQLM
jgi:hydrogenase maturation protease